MIHPDTELRLTSEEIGHGVFATHLIPRGTIVWVLDPLDFVLTPKDVAGLSPLHIPYIEKYSYIDRQGRHILCWDHGKYVNHSCKPTTVCIGSICDIAACDILPGEEVTCDYATLNIKRGFSCHCGAEGCRGIIEPRDLRSEDLTALVKDIDRIAAELIPLINTIPQPLYQTILPEDFNRIQSIISGLIPLPSCRENAYNGPGIPGPLVSDDGQGGLWRISPNITPGY